MTGSSTYGGFDALLTRMERRRLPMQFGPEERLPSVDVDFAPLKTSLAGVVPEPYASSGTNFAFKVRELHREFDGAPELLHLHGLLIACLRRRDQPPETAPLFLRLWAEEAPFLLRHLNLRWQVSAITTFGDHGATPAQRQLGQSLSILFNVMKLYESERLYSGTPPDRPFAGPRITHSLPLQMDTYALMNGGLDVNLLGRLWLDAERDAVIAPLARHLLQALDEDSRTVFRRLHLMRTARRDSADNQTSDLIHRLPPRGPANVAPPSLRRKPRDLPSWGIVSTVKAPLPQIARFVAYHLRIGAARVHVYLDDPDPAAEAFLTQDERVHVVQCDRSYWKARHGKRPRTHQRRQVCNATHCYRKTRLHWLAHVDVDEFIMPPRSMAELLALMPDDLCQLQLRPAEMLAGPDRNHFKLTARFAGVDSTALPEVYPTFGEFLRGGYISHLEGKPIVRTGIPDARLGIHTMLTDEKPVTNAAELLEGWLGHAHAPDWEHFREKLEFRLTQGSYRGTEDRFGLGEVLKFLQENEGEEGLKSFFEEVCADTPRLREALSRYGMLVTRDLELDQTCKDVFGCLPEDIPA